MTKKTTTTGIKKPRLILNDVNKFYLATQDVSDENMSDLYFVLSLFLPVKNGTIMIQPHTEISAFDDAESASIYSETLSRYCDFNQKSMVAKNLQDIIQGFKENVR